MSEHEGTVAQLTQQLKTLSEELDGEKTGRINAEQSNQELKVNYAAGGLLLVMLS